jgi:hypothetical protein
MVKHPAKDELLICKNDKLYSLRPNLEYSESTWKLHDIATERISLPRGINAVLLRACRSKDGGIIAVADDRRSRIVLLGFDYQHQEDLATPVTPEVMWLSHDASLLATGLRHESPLYIFDLSSLEQIAALNHNGTSMMGMDPDSGTLVAGSWRGYRAWNLGSWQHRYDIARGGSRQPCALAVDREGRWAVAADAGASLIRFRIDTGSVSARFQSFHPDATVWNLSLNRDSSLLAVACLQHGLQVWNLRRIDEELGRLSLSWVDREDGLKRRPTDR